MNDKHAAFAEVAVYLDCAAVQFDDGFGERKPQSDSLRIF